MNYINKYDRDGECSKVGHKAESDFSTLARSRGWEVSAASRKSNMYKHIDFLMERKNFNTIHEYMQVDVKSRKKTSRKDKYFNDDWIWLEYQNVQGRPGWLLGEASHIVFERENEFLIVPRQGLFEWSKKEMAARNGGKITIKCKAKNSKDARYKYYTRYNRDDILTQVFYKDMIEGVSGVEIWEK